MPRRAGILKNAQVLIAGAGPVGAALALDQIDLPAQNKPAVDRHRIRKAVRVAAGAVGQAERELEPVGLPLLLVGEVPSPDVEIGANARDLVAPDAIDRGGELLGVFGCDSVEGGI